jgi:polygalacturonase
MVLAPWKPVNSSGAGVTVVVDAGITLFASRDPADYAIGNCGTISVTGSTSCGDQTSGHWVQPSGAANVAIEGYGVLDMRAWDKFYNGTAATDVCTPGPVSPSTTPTAGCGWAYNRAQTYMNQKGTVRDGLPSGIPYPGISGKGYIAYGPDMFHFENSSNAVVYKITLKDCGNFCFYYGDSGVGLTAYSTKIFAPFEISNSDGFDPSYDVSNITLADSFISNGDNLIAFKSDCGSSCEGHTPGVTQAISILGLQTGAGIGVVFGDDTSGGITNVLIDELVQNGNQNNAAQQYGLGGGGGSSTQAGEVANVLIKNVCMMNETRSLYYHTSQAGQYFSNLTEQNVTILNGSKTGNSGSITLQGGPSTNPSTFTLDNVYAGTISGTPSYTDSAIGLGPNEVCFGATTPSSSCGGGVVPSIGGIANNITDSNSIPYACSSSSWMPLVGELSMQVAGLNNQTSYVTNAGSATIVLQATVMPTTTISTKEQPALTNTTVTFRDNGTPLGTGTLTNGYATYTATPGTGTHTYTAEYTGDSNYADYTWPNTTQWYSSRPVTAQINGVADLP